VNRPGLSASTSVRLPTMPNQRMGKFAVDGVATIAADNNDNVGQVRRGEHGDPVTVGRNATRYSPPRRRVALDPVNIVENPTGFCGRYIMAPASNLCCRSAWLGHFTYIPRPEGGFHKLDGQHLALFTQILPTGAADIVQRQVSRLVAHGDARLSFGFLVGLAFAFRSANAGMKAIIEALNVAYDESFIPLGEIQMTQSTSRAGLCPIQCEMAEVRSPAPPVSSVVRRWRIQPTSCGSSLWRVPCYL
jgi:hypothetical protein